MIEHPMLTSDHDWKTPLWRRRWFSPAFALTLIIFLGAFSFIAWTLKGRHTQLVDFSEQAKRDSDFFPAVVMQDELPKDLPYSSQAKAVLQNYVTEDHTLDRRQIVRKWETEGTLELAKNEFVNYLSENNWRILLDENDSGNAVVGAVKDSWTLTISIKPALTGANILIELILVFPINNESNQS